MKQLLVLFLSLAMLSDLISQIPNPSFELWTGNQPTGWKSYSNPPATPYTCETQTSSAYNGSVAVKSSVVYPGTTTLTLESGITTGSLATNYYLPIFTKPAQLFGHYILNCWNDTFAVRIWLKSGGSVIGSGSFKTKINSSTYTQFTVNLTYTSVAVPDSFRIDISFNQPGPSTLPASSYGEYFIVDDLYFDINVGVNEKVEDLENLKVYPNPSNNIIRFDVPANKEFKIEIFNSLGQYVQTEHFYKCGDPINISRYTSGIYHYKVIHQDRIHIGKFVRE